jgi:hypothetical protein
MMGPDLPITTELLEGQLAFLMEQDAPARVTAVPGFLRALRTEPRLAVHLADLHVEAQEIGRTLQAEECEDGNSAAMLELAFEEVWQKLPRDSLPDEYSLRIGRVDELLPDVHRPFVLPFPPNSDQSTGRVSILRGVLDDLAKRAPPILRLETSGHEKMVADDRELQARARIATRSTPSVALLQLEAVENLLLNGLPYAEPYVGGERPLLRVEIVIMARGPVTYAAKESMPSMVASSLDEIGGDVERAARLLVLDLRRRLYTARSRLGVVQRFKARCEWHDRERLRQVADTAQEAGRSAENALRDEMTRYLFDQGLNPLAEAVLGTSSRADVFDPSLGPAFYVEAKQYGDRDAVEGKLKGAFRQALDTVGNLPGSGYSADEVFIVLFRRGGPRVLLPGEPFSAEGIRWHFVLVNIARASEDASQNKRNPVEFTAETLRNMLLEVGSEQLPERGTAPAASG